MTATAKARHAYFVLVRLFVHGFVLGVCSIVLLLRLYLPALSPGCRQSVFNKKIIGAYLANGMIAGRSQDG